MCPQVIWGYVGAIDHVASFIEDNHFNIIPPKAIWVTAAPLSDIQRKRIERVFNAPVYEQYGCCEVFSLSSQCSQRQSLHMFHDARLIEFVDNEGSPQPAGKLGNIVLTDLENYSFPIIRYVNGDMGRALDGVCSCGVKLPLMDKVRGRQTDIIKLADGTCLAGEYLTTIFDDFPDSVKGFQVRQQKDCSIKVVYVPNPQYHDISQVIEKVRGALKLKTNSRVPLIFEAVSSIPHDRGKLQYIISEVER
jgi:phenylacetate-CoA ligase